MSWNKTVIALALGATLMACTIKDRGGDAAASMPTSDASAKAAAAPALVADAAQAIALPAGAEGGVSAAGTPQDDDTNAADDEAAELAADAAEIAAENARDAATVGEN